MSPPLDDAVHADADRLPLDRSGDAFSWDPL